jgi:hypothetical protein
MKYCDDYECPNFEHDIDSEFDCKLGFHNPLKLPASIEDTYTHNWGYKMPRVCRSKLLPVKSLAGGKNELQRLQD